MKNEDDSMFSNDNRLKESVEMQVEDIKPKVECEQLEASESEGYTSEDEYEQDSVEEGAANQPIVSKIVKGHGNWKKKGSGNDGILKYSMMKNAAVSESAATGLCTFSCTDCSASSKNWEAFRIHMRMKHNASVKVDNIESFMAKCTIHICRICSEKILCEGMHMRIHFNRRHKMNVNQYRKNYDCGVNLDETLQNGRLSLHQVGSLCTFKCPECHKTFKTIYTLSRHEHNSKKCLLNVGAKFWLNCLQDVVTHKCKTCSKLLLCDYTVIKSHVASHGFKTVREYSNKNQINIVNQRNLKAESVIDNYNVYESNGATNILKAGISKYVLKRNFMNQPKLGSAIDNTRNSKTVAVDSMLEKELESPIVGHLKFKGTSASLKATHFMMEKANVSVSAATGLCTFSCPQCPSEFLSRNQFKKHMKKIHTTEVKMTNIECFKYMSTVTIHVCKICSEKVFCETLFLNNHFKNKHNTSLASYRKKYDCGSWKERLQTTIDRGNLSLQKVGNLCSFKCPKCENIFMGLQNLRMHQTRQKRCMPHIQARAWLECIQEVVSHKCKLCSKIILCDYQPIFNHISCCHGFKSIEEYAKKTSCIYVRARQLKRKGKY